jgi:AcrR family transcriptional regulator
VTDQSVQKMSPTLRMVHSRGRPRTARLRQRILAVAARAFTERDFHDVLMEDVARECGVAKGTLYLYFSSKRALYSAVVFDDLEGLCRTLQSVAVSPPLERLRATMACLLEHLRRRRLLALVLRRERLLRPAEARRWLRGRARLSRIVRSTLSEAIVAGDLRAIDLPVGEEMLFAIVRGLNARGARRPPIDRLTGRAMDIFLRGAGRPSRVEPRRRTG